MGARRLSPLKAHLKKAGHSTNVGDEGGFAPNLKSTNEALDFVMQAISEAGYTAGDDVVLALDSAATEFYKDGKYVLEGTGETFDADGMVRMYEKLAANIPFDPSKTRMAEDDWDGWAALTQAIGDKVQLVGDDLFVTNPDACAKGIAKGHGQRDPREGQPDRHAHRNPASRRDGAQSRLPRRDVASVRRDRRLHHRRPRGRHQLRPNQNRLAVALRPHREIQPTHPHRRRTRPRRPLSGRFRTTLG